MKRQRRRFSVIAIAGLLSGAIFGSDAAGQTPNRVEVRTLSLGIVSEVNQKEIEGYYRDFVGYVARKLSSAPDVEGKVIIASTPLRARQASWTAESRLLHGEHLFDVCHQRRTGSREVAPETLAER